MGQAYNHVDAYRVAMMRTRILRVALLAVTAAMLPLAHADIYTWADASGRVNVSNISPPEGVRVISVAHVSPEAAAARDNAVREAARRADTQALEARVRQLEEEAEAAKRPPAPQVVYPPIPAPPPYRIDSVPPVQYSVYSSPPAYTATSGCDASWADCGLGWFPNVYSPSVIFLRGPGFRRFRSAPPQHFIARQPARSFDRSRRG
jgi:hypothetical protein